MEVVLPRQALSDPIEPHHPKASNKSGWSADPLATMLRVNALQQWYSLGWTKGMRPHRVVAASATSIRRRRR
jgi:hypothetical protein